MEFSALRTSGAEVRRLTGPSRTGRSGCATGIWGIWSGTGQMLVVALCFEDVWETTVGGD